MKRVQYFRYGGPEVWRLDEVEVPQPTGDQIRIRVMAAGANPMDWKIRQGFNPMLTGRRFPKGVGHDFAGVVEAVGPQATRFKAGDEVFGATGLKEAGAFSEIMVTSEKNAIPKPPRPSLSNRPARWPSWGRQRGTRCSARRSSRRGNRSSSPAVSAASVAPRRSWR